jgi:phosphate starvation-inducible PhoH-like protein
MGENESAKHRELTEQIRESKQKPKGPIKFQLQLNEEQKVAKDKILNNAITVLSGKAGSGKTLLACQVALDLLFKKSIEKIIITRPTVSLDEQLGYLPGTFQDKMSPFLQPIYDCFLDYYPQESLRHLLKDGVVEVCPLAFIRGRTFHDCFVLADEMQNSTPNQMKTFLTRIGNNTKVAITGDPKQCDVGDLNGLDHFLYLYKTFGPVEGINIVEMTTEDVKRSEIVKRVLSLYEA